MIQFYCYFFPLYQLQKSSHGSGGTPYFTVKYLETPDISKVTWQDDILSVTLMICNSLLWATF